MDNLFKLFSWAEQILNTNGVCCNVDFNGNLNIISAILRKSVLLIDDNREAGW